MAHFAELDENNIVTRVLVIGNEDCQDSEGNEDETVGIAFCRSLFGEDTNWKQTSYNSNFRNTFAGIDYTYDETNDVFYKPQPFPSWSLDENFDWVAPAPHSVRPLNTDEVYYWWDEDGYQADNTVGWVAVNRPE